MPEHLRTLGQRKALPQAGQAGAALGNGLQADRVLPGGGIAELHIDLLGDAALQREVDGPGVVANDHDASALAHQLHGLCKGALGTDGIVHHIGTALCGELRQLSAVQCTQLCGQLHGPGVVAAYADLCALTFCGNQGHQANGAVTDHGSGLPGGKAAAQHGVHSHGKRFHKAALFKADGGRQGIQSAGLYGDVLGHGTIFAVLGAGNAYDAALCAEVVHPGGEEPAAAAVFGGIKGDAVAHGPALHGFAQLRNGAAGFVAHDQCLYMDSLFSHHA